MTILNNNMRAMFNDNKSPLVANVLIERALRGDYSRTREIGPGADERGVDMLIIGTLYLMVADENTYPLVPDTEAFVLRIEHEPRMVDYWMFPDVAQAEAFMTAGS
jgi:hypothetical protein